MDGGWSLIRAYQAAANYTQAHSQATGKSVMAHIQVPCMREWTTTNKISFPPPRSHQRRLILRCAGWYNVQIIISFKKSYLSVPSTAVEWALSHIIPVSAFFFILNFKRAPSHYAWAGASFFFEKHGPERIYKQALYRECVGRGI
jgi:hypothetical protein